MSTLTNALPVAVIGAGPVGLAAAAHLLTRGETPLVLAPPVHCGTGRHVTTGRAHLSVVVGS
jgi:2-polyprenyl-6-methoxyphenol hydroxylase-like FAD-dependent oxidoreductase